MVEDPSLALRLHPTAACLLLGRDGQSSNIWIKIVRLRRRKAKEWPGKDSISKGLQISNKFYFTQSVKTLKTKIHRQLVYIYL